MVKIRSFVALLCWLCAAKAMTMPAPREDAQPAAIVPARFQTATMSLDQAVAMVQAKYGARVMRANTVEEDGRTVHYIRLMSPDRSKVWTVRIDAASGREF